MYDKVSNEITLQDGSKANIVVPQVIQVANSGYQYQYNGKEWQDELGLAWYDYGARNYDASLGRFGVVDPMTIFINNQSPYSIANNNPILNVDEYGFGIFNVIGNVFKRFGNAIHNAFVKCPQDKKYEHESVRGAWRRPDFNISHHRKFSRNTKHEDNEVKINKNRPIAENIDVILSKVQKPTFEIQEIISHPNIIGYNDDVNKKLVFDKKVNIYEAEIEFRPSTSVFKDPDLTEKTLTDFIQTLQEFPQLTVLILGNVSVNAENSDKVKTHLDFIKKLQLQRARAVEIFLIERGIDSNRLKVGYGSIRFIGQKGRTTTFRVNNN